MDRADLIRQSLELLAERAGDPADMVYRRLFTAQPEVEALFVGDKTGAARGEMLAVVLEVLLDLAEGGSYARNLIGSELVNHDQLGVPPSVFATFFALIADVTQAVLAADWTPDIAGAWLDLLTEVNALIRQQAAVSGLSLT